MSEVNIIGSLSTFTALTYSKIKTVLTEPPYTISTAQLPLAFFRFVEASRSQPSLNFRPGLTNMKAEFVVLVDASRQNLQTKNYTLMREIMEEIIDVWEASSAALQIIDYTIKEGFETVGETSFYAVVAQVEIGL